jgi:hypothetical protein
VDEQLRVVAAAIAVVCVAWFAFGAVVFNRPPRTDDFEPRVPLRARWRSLSRGYKRAVAVAAVVTVLGAGVIAFRLSYGIWPGASYPSEVAYCGRTYERGDEYHVRADELGTEVASFSAPLAKKRALLVPGGLDAHVGDSATCTMVVYIRTGRSTVLQYDLEGDSG